MTRRVVAASTMPATCAQVLDATARGLRSGLSLSSALEQACVDERIPDLAAALRRHRHGIRLADALDEARTRCTDSAVQLTLGVLAVAARHGGASAEALDRAASTLRDRAARAADARVHAAPARLSATMLAVSPLAFCALAATADHDVRRVLLATPVGWVCLVVGVLLGLGGRRWMAHLVEDAT